MNNLGYKETDNKIIISGEGFNLLNELESKLKSMNDRIEKINKFTWEGGKLSEKQKENFEELKSDYTFLRKVHDVFSLIINEDSILLFYLQRMAKSFNKTFPLEIKTSIMPSQKKELESIKEIFLSIQELYSKYLIT
jgi:hypothetical protein